MKTRSSCGRRGVVLGLGLLCGLAMGLSAEAATRSMVGSLAVLNPSVAPPFFVEGGPAVLGKKMGRYAPTTGFTTVQVDGTATGTSVGRQLTIGSNKFDFSGLVFRDFPAFAGVANVTKSFMTQQVAATLMEGAGALAACPGPGCTSSGSGTAISWCPPLAQPATPAPGTVGNRIGNWDCPSWPAGAGGGDRFLRLGISNGSGRNNFGGTMALLRDSRQNVWRVLVQPGTDGIAEVSRSWMENVGTQWTPGRTNFGYTTLMGNAGPRLFARLNANGAVTQTLGCVNPTGTVGAGKTFVFGGGPFTGPGSNCGTPITTDPPGQGWGFQLTTGDVEGSDPFPFGLVITTALPPATPFNPNAGTQPTGAGFFFTRMGTDAVSGTNRNLVLVGGGISVDPNSGNAFFRIIDLRLDMTVPEPAMGLGLVAGAVGLVVLARRRARH